MKCYEIHQVELFRAVVRTDKQTDMTELTGAFRNFADVSKNETRISVSLAVSL